MPAHRPLPSPHLVLAAVAVIVSLAMTSAAYGGVSIAPAKLELDLSRGRPAGQFVVTNHGEEEERYRVNAVHFRFGEDGGLQKVAPDSSSLVPWLKFNPKELTLPPKSNRRVRFVVVPKGRLEDKEYWAAVELLSLKKNVSQAATDDGGRSMQIEVSSSVLVPVFATHGKVRYSGAAGGLGAAADNDGVGLTATFTNTGSGHLTLTALYALLGPDGTTVSQGGFGKAYLLAGTSRQWQAKLQPPPPPGRYRLVVRGTAPQLAAPIEAATEVSW